MDDRYFCDITDVHNLILKSTGQMVDPIYFKSIMELSRKKVGNSNKYVLNQEWMDFTTFLFCLGQLRGWYEISLDDVASFIDQKFKEKYTITKDDILGVISSALETKQPEPKRQEKVKPVKSADKDMYKVVQDALKNGASKDWIQKTYSLSQRDLVKYEGYKYWSDVQKEYHAKMLEYRRLHPDASDLETIKLGTNKNVVGYWYSLIPTKEQQDAYNKQFTEKKSPKAKAKGADIKSLILSDTEKKEQEQLYSKIKEVATARNISPRDATSLLKSRMVKDYGIVIEQIKKELMMKFRVNRGEGKAPNTLEAIVMSEYLPVAKCILDDMLTESFAVR